MNVIKKIIKYILLTIYNLLVAIFPIDRKKILFESNLGKNYTGNPKAIYERMVEKGYDKDFTFIWILEDTSINIPGKCIKIKRHRLRYLFYLAIARYWIFDCRQPDFIKKRQEGIYIQTWHGTPLKKLGLDMEVLDMGGESNLDQYKANFYRNTKRWDYLLSQNKYSSEIFRSAFGFEKEMLEFGYPRNDILINNNNEESIEKLKKNLGLPKDKRIILYAPTWRDNSFYQKGKYKFNTELNIELLKEHLSEDYVIIIKAHYLVVDSLDTSRHSDFVYTFSPEQDISDLYLVSDILITDYSSVMFDYSNLKRPIIFYTFDIEAYKESIRGFYFDLELEAPGSMVQTNTELINAIKDAKKNQNKYKEQYDRFVKKYNYLDDGKASDRVIELVKSLDS
ncbi:CDP-glycerol glycerophosphotransferase family protein [Aquibacillus koreensis]|uniref:CDP-glycerol glycerophosphotransferase family protein n=1 Tax=Aquibacillus koreensis TaxID=279446 RepID=A0A9X3WLX8_9BACI|nr:CDP-glycerol glycerophosphotransferase family protein [Aquibacillus koreensis]MCT2535294.1 CDP-glycerol glycerophosphotransferase family protein [Aquibacillus koreensis]MDC3419774.1 CDP-glycerol glycerophosphotransferase family protein [Aquibacillus koreensis]